MAYKDTPLCQLHGGCVGCCGHDYPSSEAVQVAINQNTLEFKKFQREGKTLIEFRDRAPKDDLRHGLCRNAILQHENILCAIHPALVQATTDLRVRHCDIRYLCKSAKAYASWDEEKKKQFAKFTKKKRGAMTQAAYSLAMDADEFLTEFQNQR